MPYGIAFEFLDVGMGDCTLIQMPPWDRGEIVLVDFGQKGSTFTVAVEDATKFLVERISLICRNRNLGFPLIDHLFITHGDADHWNKLGDLIDGVAGNDRDLWHVLGKWPPGTKLTINRLTFGGNWQTDYKNKNFIVAQKIESAMINVNNVTTLADRDHDINNPRWASNGTNIILLSSNYPNKIGGDINNKSLVLMFEYNGYKVILPGDAGVDVEAEILRNYPANFLKSFGLKLGHHGSAGSTSAQWVDAVQPHVIFASGDRRWGHPYCASIKRVMDKGSLATTVERRWFACTCPGNDNDYRSISTNLTICNNLWYAVTHPAGEMRFGPDGKQYLGPYGLYTGVQWRLQIDGGVDPVLTHTDQWPVPDPNITPAFCPP